MIAACIHEIGSRLVPRQHFSIDGLEVIGDPIKRRAALANKPTVGGIVYYNQFDLTGFSGGNNQTL